MFNNQQNICVWIFFRAFSSVVRQMPGYNSQRRGTARTLPKFIMSFYVLFVCKCVLYYCHRVSTQLQFKKTYQCINRLTPNAPYMSRTALLTPKCCILYIYSTNVGTEYFKHALYSQFFSLQNAVCFIMLTCLVPVLFTFCIQGVLKLKKKIIPAPKG